LIHIEQAVIVEGKYDKIKLESIIDAVIIQTNGFAVFKDSEKMVLIKHFAHTNGIIILTDSDAAGFKIRNYLKGTIENDKITNVYIPDIFGKEKRKIKPSKEGKLGVEGINKDIIVNAFIKAGIYKRGMIIGADVLSRVSDPHDRDSMIYADGAGATILEAVTSDRPVGILSHATRSDTLEHAFMLWMGRSYDPSHQGNELYLKMDGHKLYEYALKTVPLVVQRA